MDGSSNNRRGVRRRHLRRRRFHGRIEAATWPGVVISLAYAGYGLGMLTQPTRFSLTPAYGNLTQMLDIRVWGALHLTVAALFTTYVYIAASRLFGIIVHIPGLIVAGVWWVAFVIRWFTDESTTIVNVVSWTVLLLIMSRSASLIPAVNRSGVDRVAD